MYAYSLKVKLYFPGPGSLPGYARRRGGDYDDGASDISSTSGFGSAYGYRSGSSKYRVSQCFMSKFLIYILFQSSCDEIFWYSCLLLHKRQREIENLHFI